MNVFEITKQISHESWIYLNSGLCQPFLRLLISLKPCEDDPNMESLSPFIEGSSYGPFIRKDQLVIEALTFAVHTLFELLLFDEQLGYEHSNISPSNIMFRSVLLNKFGR